MNQKLLLACIVCSFSNAIFSDIFFAEKVGKWPEELKDWKQVVLHSNVTSRHLGKDTLGRDIAEMTTPVGVQYHVYRYESPDGKIGESIRIVGTNKELPLVRIYKESEDTILSVLPAHADFIKKLVDTDQVLGELDDMPILYNGTGPAPDEDPFKKKLEQENPEIERAFQEATEASRHARSLGVVCIETLLDEDDKEIMEARDKVRNQVFDKVEGEGDEVVIDPKFNSASQSSSEEFLMTFKPHAIPILGVTVVISGAVYLLHYIRQGEYQLAHASFWSSWKSEEPLDILMGIPLNSFVCELKKDIDSYYQAEKDPIACFLHDIEKEVAKIEPWLVFRDKLSLIFGSYAYRLYTFAEENLALLNRMKKAAFVLRKKTV